MLIPALKQPTAAYVAGQNAYLAYVLEGIIPSITVYLVDEAFYNDFWAGWKTERLDYMEAVHA